MILYDLIKDLLPKEYAKIPKYSLGFYEEENAYKFIEPKGQWNTKINRPFLVVHEENNDVYFILLTTSNNKFGCTKDEKYGAVLYEPLIDTEKCIADKVKCNWIKGKSKIFKLKIRNNCFIVLKIKRFYFDQFFHICGKCDEKVIPDVINLIVREELKGWNITSF